MPWNNDYTKFTSPPSPAVRHAPLPEGVSERDPIAHEIRSREHVLDWEWKRRMVVEMAEMPRYCPRKGCRRSRACVSPTVACFQEQEDLLRKDFIPRLVRAMKEDKRRREAAGLWPPSANDPERR